MVNPERKHHLVMAAILLEVLFRAGRPQFADTYILVKKLNKELTKLVYDPLPATLVTQSLQKLSGNALLALYRSYKAI